MSWMMKVLVLPLVLLCLWQLQEGAQACRCAPKHPQEHFCRSDVVIRAKVGRVTVDNVSRRLKYDIQLTETLKGPKLLFHAIYTPNSLAACGVLLNEDRGTEYLFMATLDHDGTLHISSCDFLEPWEALSATQKNLLQHYQMGCDCKIKRCYSFPCGSSGPKQCWWVDFLLVRETHGEQAQNFACIKGKNGSCAWYRGQKEIH
ncbi:metalloproteinase inhibitor 2-like [Corythoichthys intestinalis]|uniref:metalloproteinase inhibitor 2-like n=1 Tax=Corythoichthys intestinalis TaxID=161448 RepID=UPI0025A59F44|nr:metalloproteinase inhibitor 2-like [Corythoichthys intestinalis]